MSQCNRNKGPSRAEFFPYLTPPVLRNDSQYIFIERISYFLLLQWLLIPIYFDFFFLWTEISEWISHSTWREKKIYQGKRLRIYYVRFLFPSLTSFRSIPSFRSGPPLSIYLSIYIGSQSREERDHRESPNNNNDNNNDMRL